MSLLQLFGLVSPVLDLRDVIICAHSPRPLLLLQQPVEAPPLLHPPQELSPLVFALMNATH